MSGFRILLDSNGQDLAVEHVQDIEPYLDYAKTMRDYEQKSDWGRATHEIPHIEEMKLLNEQYAKGNNIQYGSKEWTELFKRKLKSGDWECYRIDRPSLMMGFGS